MTNLIVYLIEEFNVNRIDAAQMYNAINGCFCLLPILGAIIADSVLGCFLVAPISSVTASMGIVLLSLTAALNSLRSTPCGNESSSCKAPSNLQFAVLHMGIVLAALGAFGVRFTPATFGANQFESQNDQSTFFNWFFFAQYAGYVLSSTLITYIEDSMSWALGFWLCVAANLIGLAVFVAGNRYYRHEMPQGSPLLSLACVLVASFRKRKLQLTLDSDEFYYGRHGQNKEVDVPPKMNFRFLNRAAAKTDGDTNSDNSIAKPWRLCTAQHVEDLKSVIKMLPLWSSAIFLSTPIAVQNSMTVRPRWLSNSATVMVAATIGISYYLSTVLVDLVRKSTGRLPENLNDGGLDCMYWLLAGVGMANFGYYVVCAKLNKGKDGSSSSSPPMTDDIGGNKMRS